MEEVRKRRPKGEGRLSTVALQELRSGYEEQATPVRTGRADSALLERRLSDLVNTAYGLTPEEVTLLWETAHPGCQRCPVPDRAVRWSVGSNIEPFAIDRQGCSPSSPGQKAQE